MVMDDGGSDYLKFESAEIHVLLSAQCILERKEIFNMIFTECMNLSCGGVRR